jgi:hypothetical protein
MERLSKNIVSIIVDEYGSDDFLCRLSDPFWFQAFGCVLGYDWHSSGVTTVVMGALKRALTPAEHGIAICGGKGKASTRTPQEIMGAAGGFGFSTAHIDTLRYASRMSAKVDNAAIQAGYQLYHHTFVMAENRKWAVVQQGLCPADRTARRYHWLSDHTNDFVVEPHEAIVGDAQREKALNMTAKESEEARKISVDISREKPERIMRMIMPVRPLFQASIVEWLPGGSSSKRRLDGLSMPVRINWKALKQVYEFQPADYEQLLGFEGVGPATIRGLALISELVYGAKPSWKDPVKYSFAYGGKDGVPYPVNRSAMDESIQILKDAVQQARIGNYEKARSLQRLRTLVPPDRSRPCNLFPKSKDMKSHFTLNT